MKVDEVVKALRICLGDYTSNEDCEKCPYYLDDDSCACDRNPLNDAADLLEQLQAENEQLKAEKPMTCGEVASHSEKEIVEGCITLMQRLTNKFKEYLEFVEFEPECEEERFGVDFYMGEIVKTLLLAGTSHSGGTSTAKKCKELGFNYSSAVTFDFEEDTE